jgi:hypothetical protein
MAMTDETFLADIERDECRLALRQLYGCDAHFNTTVVVSIPARGRAPWQGSVHVFDISGHPTATRGYAWPRRVNAQRTVIHTVLESDAVAAPEHAVRTVLGRRHLRAMQ